MNNLIVLSDLIGLQHVEVLALIFSRVAAFVFLLPGVGESYVPARYKLVITLVLSFALLPASPLSALNIEIGTAAYWGILIREIFYGLVLGIIIRMAVFSLQIAGTIIAQSSSIAQIFGGSVSNDAQSTVSNILTIGGVTLLMTTGFLDNLLIFVDNSYDWFQFDKFHERGAILDLLLDKVRASYSLAFQLALPFLALSLFYNITLGTINRAMPQLLVSFVGAPAIIAASMALLIISVEPMLGEWRNIAFESMEH